MKIFLKLDFMILFVYFNGFDIMLVVIYNVIFTSTVLLTIALYFNLALFLDFLV